MKGIIVYKSNYGSTKQYAQWLGEDTGFKILEQKQVKKNDLEDSDVVVVGCPVFAGQPVLGKWIHKKWSVLKDKKTVLYTTSGALPSDPELQKNFENTFNPEIREKLMYFPQGGRVAISEMKGFLKFIMKLGIKMAKDPEVKKEMGTDKDNVNREGLKPLLAHIS